MFIVANVPSYWHHLQPPRLIVEWAHQTLKNMLQAKKGNMGIKDVRAL
jgi:hypothetical protein